MEENNQKVNFFKRVKTAIFKLEDYGIFLGERFSVALKYFLLLMCIVAIIFALLDTFDFSKMISKAYYYIQNELPDFSYENEKLNVSEVVEAYDEEFKFKLIIDTNSEITEEQIKDYKNKIYDSEFGILALENKLIYIGNNLENEYDYKDILELTTANITNKYDLTNFLNQNSKEIISISFGITDFIIYFISNSLTIFLDILLVSVFGLLAARFCSMRFKITPMISLGIYSMTLSIILLMIYRIVNALTGFVIEYFEIMYLLIAYVYIIAAIMMVKYDLMKQQYELSKIMEVQKEVHKEIEEENKKDDNENEPKKEHKKNPKENDDDKKEDKEPDINGREPDGSEI